MVKNTQTHTVCLCVGLGWMRYPWSYHTVHFFKIKTDLYKGIYQVKAISAEHQMTPPHIHTQKVFPKEIIQKLNGKI